ncbi:hypothetical protein D3C81_1804370 [compost metagenome]
MVGGLAREVATVGLDLFQAIASGVVAVGAATHPEAFELAFEGNFRLIASRALGHHPLMPLDAFLGRGRRGKA